MRTYEGIFILRHPDDDTTTTKRVDMISSELTKLGGSVSSITRIGKNTFARAMNKQDSGTYILAVFSMAPENVNALVSRCRLNENILRVHVVAASRLQDESGAEEKNTREESAQTASV